MFVYLFFAACMEQKQDTAIHDQGHTQTEDTDVVEIDGAVLYGQHCAPCHGEDARGVSNMGPDLQSALVQEDAYFVDVIRNGKGNMFSIAVSEEEAYAIVMHIREIFAD